MRTPVCYSEWGYAALTRHRDRAYFYVNGPEAQLLVDDFAPDSGDLSEGLVPLTRSHAKGMATELIDAGAGPSMDADLGLRAGNTRPRARAHKAGRFRRATTRTRAMGG